MEKTTIVKIHGAGSEQYIRFYKSYQRIVDSKNARLQDRPQKNKKRPDRSNPSRGVLFVQRNFR